MSGRHCGACQLCCKLVPVQSIGKPAGQRCRHQRVRSGCGVYRRPAMPVDCRIWSCRWLADPESTAGLQRPDRSHLVIDLVPDFVSLRPQNDPEAEPIDVQVIQVWLDPAYPDAHRSAAFRAYLLAEAEANGVAALVRFSATEGVAVFPPPLASDGEWHEIAHGQVVENTPERIRKMWGGGAKIVVGETAP